MIEKRTERALDRLMQPAAAALRRGAGLSCLQALLWPAQAGLVALSFAQLLAGQGFNPGLVLGFVALGLLRLAFRRFLQQA